MPDQKEATQSGIEFFVRLYWLFIGNVILFFILAFILEKHLRFPSILDALYLCAIVALILVRYVDIRFLKGETGEGKPATMAHWRRYTMLISLVGVGAWLLFRGFIHFF